MVLTAIKKPLVLYFDINATILMSDPAGNKTIDEIINDSLGRIAWGRYNEKERVWVYDTSVPLSLYGPPCCDTPPETKWITYESFIDDICYPQPAEFDSWPPEKRRAQWGQLRLQRKSRKSIFTSPGEPGETLRTQFDTMKQKLFHNDGTPVGITSTFFSTIGTLLEEFSDIALYVIFRTFGSDGERVAKEWNLYVCGQHPYFALPAGVNGEHLVIHPQQCGQYTRTSASSLTLTWQSQEETTSGKIQWCDTIPEIQKRWTALLLEGHPKGGAFCIRDHYDYWAAGGEKASCGKPIAVHPSQPYWSVFADDNIEVAGKEGGRGIVDVRDALTGDIISPERSSAYLIPVDSYHATVPSGYFLNKIKECIERQQVLCF